jgi:hypothetical protein
MPPYRTRLLVLLVAVAVVGATVPTGHLATATAASSDPATGLASADSTPPSGTNQSVADTPRGNVTETGPSATARRPGGVAARAPAVGVVTRRTNTTNFLSIRIGSAERKDYGQGSVDVGAAISTDVEQLRAQRSEIRFEDAYSEANSSQERRALLRAESDRIETRIGELETRQRQTVSQYNTRRISTKAFLRQLAAINTAAGGLDARLRAMQDRLTDPGFDSEFVQQMWVRIETLRGMLVQFQGPVRDRITHSIHGNESSVSVYVVTSTDGLTISALDDDTYYREAYAGTNRNTSKPDRFTPSQAATAIEQNYTWATRYGGPSVSGFGNASIYWSDIRHPHGRLIVYFDGGTKRVFKETQVKSIDTLPTRTKTNVSAGVELVANTSHPTGPLQVTVRNATTGEPIQATIRIRQPGDNRVGTTDRDGVLLTLTGHRFTQINATTADGRSVTLWLFPTVKNNRLAVTDRPTHRPSGRPAARAPARPRPT